jgi:D-alanyl-D-alanine carboxypeptidase/D-alanyl-D-alanine-endopeptidase (penicillin-binding protein 4)
MGAESVDGTGEPTTVRAERAVRRWLASHALDDRGLVLENGSGLSRSERISPELLAGVLQAALASPWSAEILASLPIVGVDGGMRNRAADGPARGTSRIKTGTLRDVSAIAGYVQGDQRYIVVAMIHHDRAVKQAARPVLDALVDWVARGMPAD